MSSVRLIRLPRGCTAAAEDAYLERLARENDGFGNSSMSRFGRSMPAVRPRLMLPQHEWTAEEDARLERLARENGFRHWLRVARRMPGRSRRLCRARWRHLTAEREACYLRAALAALSHRDEAELLSRDWMRRWSRFVKKAVRSSPEKAEEYWKEFMKNAATGFAEEGRCRTAPLPDVAESEPEPEPASTAPMQQHSLADVLALGLSSCSLAPVDPRDGSLAVGFARMTI
ncbi:hypothetical protein ZWY2020_023037 [Hordeum vulgare]|nr:hypothetical protein ZWY2020_023037 [Hordeum vulgare]